MPRQLNALSELSSWSYDDIIDVRSPDEFADDHVPGAINLPVLSNEERALVGTIYVQESAFKAKRIGAAIVARNAADHIEGPLSDRGGSWQPLIYCWRGGQRSGSFASILSQIGWRAELLQGGYKSYRRLVVQALYNQAIDQRIILIDGNTGTAKTEILGELKKAGAQVIDLEGLAAHRGSLLGAMKGGQPSQKSFESHLAMQIAKLDPTKPLFLEAESNKIGDILIPPSLWQAMCAASRITIDAPLAARSEFLTRSYSDLLEDTDALRQRVQKLSGFHSKEQIEDWVGLIDAKSYRQLAHELMQRHYDPRYAKTYQRGTREELGVVTLSDLNPPTLRDQAVSKILDLTAALTDI